MNARALARRILRPAPPSVSRAEGDELQSRVHAMDVGLQELIGGVRSDLTREVDRLRAENDALRAVVEASIAHLGLHLDESVEALRLHAQRHAEEVGELAIEQMGGRVGRLERLVRSSIASPPAGTAPAPAPGPGPAAATTPAPATPGDGQIVHSADAMSYGAFEEEMRGPSSLVTSIQRSYLDDVAAFGAPDLPILDIGCGRGEFLELLREVGVTGVGLDVNEMFVEACRAAGFEATLGDALSHLRTLADASLRGITAFHVVEHIPMAGVAELLASAFRVIAPGGGLLLETPDPENLAVGAHRFWFDPTHLRPVPSPLLRFLVRDAGFEQVEVRRLHPLGRLVEVPSGTDPVAAKVAEIINESLGGPIDYLIVARRPVED